MFTKIHKRMKSQKGFTLIELLVVIIIIAILAAIAIPTFLGQRQKAQDSAAKSLVRNAMTSIESAYVDTRDFEDVTEAMLTAIEPSIDWAGGAIGTETVYATATADCDADQVDVGLMDPDNYEIGTVSLSGKIFGVTVNKSAEVFGEVNPGNTFYITDDDGNTTEGW